MHGSPHLATESAKLEAEAVVQSAKLTGLRKERAENDAVLEGVRRRIEHRRTGAPDDPRAHIRHAAEPVPAAKMRFDRAAELWAALSISVLLIGLAVLILVAPTSVWGAILVLVILFIVGESILRGTFIRTVNRIAVILALVAVVVLFVQYWKLTFVALLIGLAGFLLYQRLRELRA